MTRLQQLEKRIEELKLLQADELKTQNPSHAYLEDLTISIRTCESQRNYIMENPSGIEFVNGG